MPVFPGFCGPSNRSQARAADNERTINKYVESVDAGSPTARDILYQTAGSRLFTFLGSGPVRATFAQDGRCFAVSGAIFWEILPSKVAIPRGGVATGGFAATISSNGFQGNQLFITAGFKGYIFDLVTSVFTQITDVAFPTNVLQGLFFDSYFVALDADRGDFVISDSNDGLSWNGLDFGFEEQFSDRVIGMTRTHDNLWLFGTKNTGPWYDSGNASFPFQPVQGALIEHGTAAAFACVEIDNSPMWLGADEQGQGMVWRANGYTPTRVSTHAIERQIRRVKNLSGALAFGYQQQGHTFYVLYIPGLDTTLCYDIATGQWHERAHWDVNYGRYFPHVMVNHCLFQGRNLVGDRQSGAVYELPLDFYDDRLILAGGL